jgi:hypothetical protein
MVIIQIMVHVKNVLIIVGCVIQQNVGCVFMALVS